MRKLLGLDEEDDEEEDWMRQGGDKNADGQVEDDDSFFGGADEDDNDDDEDEEGTKSFTYIPGKQNLEEKIRTKLNEKNEESKELTPWEQFKLKRKEKRKEKKRQAKEEKLVLQGKIESSSKKNNNKIKDVDASKDRAPSSKEELDLLLAGDNGEFVTLIGTSNILLACISLNFQCSCR